MGSPPSKQQAAREKKKGLSHVGSFQFQNIKQLKKGMICIIGREQTAQLNNKQR